MLMKKQYVTLDDVYAAIGYGGIQLWKVMPRIKEECQKTYAAKTAKFTSKILRKVSLKAFLKLPATQRKRYDCRVLA